MSWINYYYQMFVDLSEEAKNITLEREKDFRKKLDIYAKGWARLKYDEQGEVSFLISQHYKKEQK